MRRLWRVLFMMPWDELPMLARFGRWVIVVSAVIFVVILINAIRTERCYFMSEEVAGRNKICYYSCPSGTAAMTIKAVALCPLSIQRLPE